MTTPFCLSNSFILSYIVRTKFTLLGRTLYIVRTNSLEVGEVGQVDEVGEVGKVGQVGQVECEEADALVDSSGIRNLWKGVVWEGGGTRAGRACTLVIAFSPKKHVSLRS